MLIFSWSELVIESIADQSALKVWNNAWFASVHSFTRATKSSLYSTTFPELQHHERINTHNKDINHKLFLMEE
jgi:hypothetical protein